MVKTRSNLKKENSKLNNIFKNSCILSYKVHPLNRKNIHERKFDVNSKSGNKYTITINRLVDCTCPDCQYRVRRCKHINFIMNNILEEEYPRIYYDNEALDSLFKNLPVNATHKYNWKGIELFLINY